MVERVVFADAAKKRLASQEALATKAAAGAARSPTSRPRVASRRRTQRGRRRRRRSRSRALAAAAGRRALAAAPATLAISVAEDGAAHIDVGANGDPVVAAGFAHQPSAGGGLGGGRPDCLRTATLKEDYNGMGRKRSQTGGPPHARGDACGPEGLRRWIGTWRGNTTRRSRTSSSTFSATVECDPHNAPEFVWVP